jgi:hypothetical protein
VRNIDVNALVCVSFIDVFVQKGFKVMGAARSIHRSDPAYAEWARPLLAKAGPRFPIHSVIVVQAQTVEPIVAPSYRLYPDTATEQSQMEAALRIIGVSNWGQIPITCGVRCGRPNAQLKPRSLRSAPERSAGREHRLEAPAGAALWCWNTKIFADLFHQVVVYFVVTRNCTSFVQCWVVPPGMAAAFSQQ